MEIKGVVANNLKELNCKMSSDVSIGLAGLSGSGKSTFCSVLADESLRRVITILPKSQYRFLFNDILCSNYSAQNILDIPLIFYLGKSGFPSNPRSTLGTHSGVFKEVREKFAKETNLTSEFFSFNNSIMWCNSCKGRGSTAGKICKKCAGTRYDSKIVDYKVTLQGKTYSIIDINEMNCYKLLKYAEELGLSSVKKKILQNLIDFNVGYLSLDRLMSTLSGGEIVRVLLAEFMAQCKNSLIIIDEVSIGLDRDTLVSVLEKISKLGENNQIWLIDHSDLVLNATKEKIFFGPGSGKNGGNIVKVSPRPKPEFREINTTKVKEFYNLKNLKKRNIDIDSLSIPKNRITSITGESGCGKSTLVEECIIPYFQDKYKKVTCITIGQDRNQSITSRSTITSFLDLTQRLKKYDDEILSKDLDVVSDLLRKDKNIKRIVEMLLNLGLGYLSLDRKIQTLSTGEFQCIHLVSKLSENMNKEMVLIFDEPSKGLSQNILNLFMKMMETILQDEKKTILIIEHNPYFLECSDFIIDFGKRQETPITKLEVVDKNLWKERDRAIRVKVPKIIKSEINIESLRGIEYIHADIDNIFNKYENIFKGGLLKQMSKTAEWIYGDYKADEILPVIAIDLEKSLYSKDTFIYEISGLINCIIQLVKPDSTSLFDLYSTNNLCECCKGTGKIETIDLSVVINDKNKGLWDGLLKEEIMAALKNYNYSKIKFLFKEIKKATGCDLSKSLNKMSDEEKRIFLYGYWEQNFYDTTKKTQRQWRGIIHLIVKYMKSSKSELKKRITESFHTIVCPTCNGGILKHHHELDILGTDIREIITGTIKDNKAILMKINRMAEILKIVGEELSLNADVSTLPLVKQVKLKMLDIQYANLMGFNIVIKNSAPFWELIKDNILKISKNNKIILLDYPNIHMTKEHILEKFYSKGKIKPNSYVFEVFKYSKINTSINKIGKSAPCKYCNGKKVLREESIFEGVDITETPCLACEETGIKDEGLALLLEGISVRTWLKGNMGEIKKDIPDNLKALSPLAKIRELNKVELIDLAKYKEMK